MGLFAQLSLLTGSDIKETEIRKLSVALRGATFQRRPRSFKSMFESFNGPTTTTPQSMEPVGGGRVRLRKCVREKKRKLVRPFNGTTENPVATATDFNRLMDQSCRLQRFISRPGRLGSPRFMAGHVYGADIRHFIRRKRSTTSCRWRRR